MKLFHIGINKNDQGKVRLQFVFYQSKANKRPINRGEFKFL